MHTFQHSYANGVPHSKTPSFDDGVLTATIHMGAALSNHIPVLLACAGAKHVISMLIDVQCSLDQDPLDSLCMETVIEIIGEEAFQLAVDEILAEVEEASDEDQAA
jgi:hypothetical protein